MHKAIAAGLVAACHDLSEGGIAVAIAEMVIGSGLGAELHLDNVPHDGQIVDDITAAFSESLGRFLIEVPPEHMTRFEAIMVDYPVATVGRVLPSGNLRVFGLNDNPLISADLATLTRAWRQHLESP